MRTIFWGTPQISVPFLEFLQLKSLVCGVVTQTDKPSKRGQKIQKSPVKVFAEEKQIPVFQPEKLKNEEFLGQIKSLKPEIGIVTAYGRIIPKEAIALFPKGLFNIHFSLLPHLRGAAPIQWAIVRGDSKTGVSSFRITETLDTGNIISQKEIDISPLDNAITLEEKLVPLGLLVLEETIRLVENALTVEILQKGEITQAPLIKKEHTRIHWDKPAEEIARQIRGLIHPGAFCKLPDGKILKIIRGERISSEHSGLRQDPTQDASPGTICGFEKNRSFLVKCGTGTIAVIRVQMEGKKEMDAWSFLQGRKLLVGQKLD